MALKGSQILYNLILKNVAKESGQASGILSIGKDVRKLADKKFQNYVISAQKQGVDLDKLSEQEIKYMLELNKPKAPQVLSNEEAFEFLNRFLNQGKKGEVVKFPEKAVTDWTKARPTITVESVITDIKKLEPIESMKEANRVLRGEGKYKNLSKADREKIVGDESVTDHIFERNIEPDPEDLAGGGLAGMLGEPTYMDEDHRVPYDSGKLVAGETYIPPKNFYGVGLGPLLDEFMSEGRPRDEEGFHTTLNKNDLINLWNYLKEDQDIDLEDKLMFRFGRFNPDKNYMLHIGIGKDKKEIGFKKKFNEGGRVPYNKGGSILDVLPPDFDELDPEELMYIVKLLQAGEIPQYASGGRVPMVFGGRTIGVLKNLLTKFKKSSGIPRGEKTLKSDKFAKNLMSKEDKLKLLQLETKYANSILEHLKADRQLFKQLQVNKEMKDKGLDFLMKHFVDTQAPHMKNYKNLADIDQAILELETLVKNKTLKEGRQLNASGGLEPRTMDQAALVDELEPGALKDELLKDFDPSQETYEEYLQRKSLERPFNMAQGGRIGFDSGGKADQLLKVYLEEGANSPIKREVKKAILKNPAFKKFIGKDKLKELATFSSDKKGWTERNLISNFTTYRDHMNKLPNKGKGYISATKLADKLGIPESAFWRTMSTQGKGRYPQYNLNEIQKVLGESQIVIGERGTGNKFHYYKDPSKKEIKALQKFFERPILGKDTVKGLNAFFDDTELMKMLDDRIFPEIEDAQRVLKAAKLPASEHNAATAMLRLAEVLQGKKFKNEINIKPNKVLGNYIYKQIDDFDMTHPWARGVYDAAVREIAENMPTQVGSIEKYKKLLKGELPDGFLEKKKLNMNEIFSVKGSARNKAYPYAYFIDVIDADLNQKELAKFHGHLSKAQTNLKNKIGQIRQTENPKFRKALYKEAEDIVKKFEGTRKRWRKTIKKNYPGKNFNLPNIVLGKEKEILAKDMKIAENIYKKADLDKWAAKGVDIAGHAKKTGYVMTGAADKTAMFAPDIKQQRKFLKQAGFNIDKCLSSGGRVKLQGGGGANPVNTCIREVIEEEQKKGLKGNKVSLEKFGKFGKLARTAGWFLGPIDIPIELGFALPHMLAGDKEAAKRATTFGLFGYGKDKMDEIKAGSPESYKYLKHLKDNEDYINTWFENQDLNEDLANLKKDIVGKGTDIQNYWIQEKENQIKAAEDKINSIVENYKGYYDEEGKFDVWGEAKGKSALQDYLIKDVTEKTDKGLDMKEYGGHGMNIALGLPWNFGMKEGIAPFKGGQPITNLKQYIAQRGQPYWKQLEHAAYELGRPELFNRYFTTADVREPEDAYSDLPIKYASELGKLEKEEMLRGLKAKGLHGTVGFKKMLEAQGIDPQEVRDVGKKDWEFDILGKRRLRASGGRAGYMGGGITGIRKPSAIPPERQGLRSIMINGKKS